jgi:hypothetical protein
MSLTRRLYLVALLGGGFAPAGTAAAGEQAAPTSTPDSKVVVENDAAALPKVDESAPSPRRTTAWASPPKEPELEPLPEDPRSKALIERVEARWAALRKRDFDRAYTFEAPTFRAAIDVDQYANKFGPFVTWHSAEVTRLQYEDEHQASIGVVTDHSFIAPTTEEPIRNRSLSWERWIEEDKEWWHQPNWAKLPKHRSSR